MGMVCSSKKKNWSEVLFYSLIKGITLKICMLYFVLINSVLFCFVFMCLDLVLEF